MNDPQRCCCLWLLILGSRPALAKFAPSERFGASRPKKRPALAEFSPSERICPFDPAPSARRGGRLFAREGRLLSASRRNPRSQVWRWRDCSSAPAHVAESALPARFEPFIRCEFRQKRAVFRLGSRNPLTRCENRPNEAGFQAESPGCLSVGFPPLGGRSGVPLPGGAHPRMW